ncbi:MAG: DUF523 domain-containing protein [Ruminococcaceae bacterium]|nr:DUF523 domain-containing protein [Oscillospiraceae bacterium]
MEKLLVSACLLGVASRYDGKSKKVLSENEMARLAEKYDIVPFCPEIYGGLPTPRVPSERRDGGVYMKNGECVTENYNKGAAEALHICRLLGIGRALLKERSPACGKDRIYDGSFSGVLVPGAGVAAELLMKNGISVYGESDIAELLK